MNIKRIFASALSLSLICGSSFAAGTANAAETSPNPAVTTTAAATTTKAAVTTTTAKPAATTTKAASTTAATKASATTTTKSTATTTKTTAASASTTKAPASTTAAATTTPAVYEITGISDSKVSITAGKTYQVQLKWNVSALDENNGFNNNVVINNHHKNIVSIDSKGLITGIAPGTAYIQFSSKSKPGSYVELFVTVEEGASAKPTIKAITPEELTMKPGDTAQLQLTWTSKDLNAYYGFNDNVTISNSHKNVVSIDKTGKVTALAEGMAYLQFSSKDTPGVYKDIIIKVEKPSVLLGDPSGDSLIDANDASLVLAEYAAVSTGKKSALTAEQKSAADVNGDKLIDANDASVILSYYAHVSTGGNDDFPTFYKKNFG